MKSIQISIPSILENIRMIESFIDNAKEKYQLTDDIYGNIMVAVTESVSNAIVHGNRGDKGKNVHLELTLENNRIRFSVEDEGSGFDFKNLPDPTSPEFLEKPGGRGIFLMRHLCDEVSFSNAGRRVEMLFYL